MVRPICKARSSSSLAPCAAVASNELQFVALDALNRVDIGGNGDSAESSAPPVEHPADICKPGFEHRVRAAHRHIREKIDMAVPKIGQDRGATAVGERHERTVWLFALMRLEVHTGDGRQHREKTSLGRIGCSCSCVRRLGRVTILFAQLVGSRRG